MSSGFCLPTPPLLPQALMGIDGLVSYSVFGENPLMIQLSMVTIGTLLLVFAYLHLPPGDIWMRNTSAVRKFTFLYCLITGIFFFLLITQLNKLVVLAAAVHNLIEWGIISNMLLPNPKKAFFGFALFIWLVVLPGILYIDDVLKSFAFEEVLGLWPDFILLMGSWLIFKVWSEKGDPRRKGYKYWANGASWHMAQIVTLLFQGFGLIPPTIAQGLIIVTVFPNYYNYWQLGMKWDEITMAPEGSDVPTTKKTDDAKRASSSVRSPPKISTCSLVTLFVVALVCSSTLVLGPFLMFGQCPAHCSEVSGAVLHWETIKVDPASTKAFETSLPEIIQKQRNNKDNIFFKAFVGNAEPLLGQYMFAGKWTTTSAAKKAQEALWDATTATVSHWTTDGLFSDNQWQQLESTCTFPVSSPPAPLATGQSLCPTNLTGTTLFQCKPDKIEACSRMMGNMPDSARKEHGSSFYFSTTGVDNYYWVMEQWLDAGALSAHLNSPAVRYLVASQGALVVPGTLKMASPWGELVKCPT